MAGGRGAGLWAGGLLHPRVAAGALPLCSAGIRLAQVTIGTDAKPRSPVLGLVGGACPHLCIYSARSVAGKLTGRQAARPLLAKRRRSRTASRRWLRVPGLQPTST